MLPVVGSGKGGPTYVIVTLGLRPVSESAHVAATTANAASATAPPRYRRKSRQTFEFRLRTLLSLPGQGFRAQLCLGERRRLVKTSGRAERQRVETPTLPPDQPTGQKPNAVEFGDL